MNQHNVPAAIVMVWKAGSRLTMTDRMATVPTLPKVIKSGPMAILGKARLTTQPSPVNSGAANIQRFLSATTRSTAIKLPRNPETINGPWVPGRLLCSPGSSQPRRSRPAHNPAKSASREKRRISGRNRDIFGIRIPINSMNGGIILSGWSTCLFQRLDRAKRSDLRLPYWRIKGGPGWAHHE